jgi:tetratricopeptide (TPR) repeat protein
MSKQDAGTLEAVEVELNHLRDMLRKPEVADQMTSAILSKLRPGSSMRDRLQAAKVAQVMLDLGEPLRAGSLFQLLLELDPKEPYYRVGRGQAHLRAGEVQAAIMRFDEALSMDDALVEAYMGRAEARLKVDRTREAFEDFEKVVELDPQSTFAQLARVMMMGAGGPSGVQ